MGEYILPHETGGELQRLELRSALLDPIELDHIAKLGVGPRWRCLELGSGNGSISTTLAERVAPGGQVIASDIAYIKDLKAPCLEVRRLDVLQGAIEEGR
jgi:tRNA A58 N-methylase Trm61